MHRFLRLLPNKGAIKRLDEPGFWVLICVFVGLVGLIVMVVFWEWLSSPEDSGSTTVRNVSLVIAGIIALVLAIWRSLVLSQP